MLLPVEEALKRLLDGTSPVSDTESMALNEAGGRVLAADLAATLTQPPFDNSAMDGYAVFAADVATIGNRLKVIGQSAAGHGFDGKIERGEAVRIFTGAPVPAGADCVLLQEDATLVSPGLIENSFSPGAGRHIRPRGQDFVRDEVVLIRGMVMDAGRLTLAAAMNHPVVEVYRKPLVAILATGDELVPVGTAPASHQIVASSLFGVAQLARNAGADVMSLGIVRDDRQAIAAAVSAATEAGADVLVTLGGASVGDHDLVQPVLKSLGMVLDFWKIAMRPGKPLMVGALGGMRVIGLPGNPVSSMVCALLFLEPLVASMARLAPPRRASRAISAVNLAANDHRQDYLRARLTRDNDGKLVAHSFGKQDSSQMKIFANADALIVRPPNAPALEAGEECSILTLRDVFSPFT